VFALKIAKPQTKAAKGSTSRLAIRRSVIPGHRLGHDPREQTLVEGNTPIEIAPRSVSWDFRKFPAFPPERASRAQPLLVRGRQAVEPKLVIGPVDDPLEREADRVADHVMRMPDPDGGAQQERQCADRQNEEPVVRSIRGAIAAPGGSEAPAIVHDALRGPATRMDDADRAFFEPRFGRDFSGVSLHHDALAAQSAQRIGALAYTVGPQIVLDPGRWRRGTPEGNGILAHELTHVVQEASGSVLHTGGGVLRRQETDAGPRDAGVPLPAGVPEPRAVKDIPDAELGWEYHTALDNKDFDRAEAIDEEMDKRFSGWGTAVPRGPDPVVGGSGAVTPEVALSLLDNMSRGEAPFKPELGLGGARWFTTEGNPYTSVDTSIKSINVQVEIAKGSEPLVFREADLLQILKEELPTTRQIAEKEFREKFGIPGDKPLSNRALKKIERTLDRFNEKRMWTKVGEKVAASPQKVGEVIFEPGSEFSDNPGKFAVVADGSKVTLKGGVQPVVDALAKQGVAAEPVVIDAAEALAKKLRWAGRVRTAFRYGGRVLIVVAIAADLYKVYRAQDKLKAVVTSAGGWAGATAAGAAFAAWFTPGDAAGPWAWAAHGVGTLIAGGIGYWFGSETTRSIYELAAE
jgi:hypothetical protein